MIRNTAVVTRIFIVEPCSHSLTAVQVLATVLVPLQVKCCWCLSTLYTTTDEAFVIFTAPSHDAACYPHYRTATVTTLPYMAIVMESLMLHQECIMTYSRHHLLFFTSLCAPGYTVVTSSTISYVPY